MNSLDPTDIKIISRLHGIIEVPAGTLVQYRDVGIQINCNLNEPEFASQPYVTVNTEELPTEHDVGDTGIPAIAIHLNDVTLYDVDHAGTDTADMMERLRKVHEASQGKGDQGAWDVWNEVTHILGIKHDDDKE